MITSKELNRLMAIVSDDSVKSVRMTQMFTPEKFNMNGTWDVIHHSTVSYNLALVHVMKELKKDPFAHLRIEALEKTDDGIHIHYDVYF